MPGEPREAFPPGGGPFHKPNPGGRPKRTPEIREALKLGGIKAVNKMVEYIDHADPRISLDACKWVGDQAIGKAAQEITGPDGEPLLSPIDWSRLTDDQLRALVTIGRAATSRTSDDPSGGGGTPAT